MWSKRQSLLIDQLCVVSNIQNSATSVKGQFALLVDDVAISLLPGRADDSICVVVQLGQPTKNLELLSYKRLLELNLVLDQSNHQRMAIDPVTGAALFIFEIFPSDTTHLLVSLQRAAACAKAWQQDHFLDPQSMKEVA
ncbi:MAG: hypothetical protein RL001_1415 [Pseudomonadota bacterium]|jgi:Tir chaperone protein (CesT) family|nr:hypothetical protein [Oxalobacteraceae bacterium]